jgi:4-amino-4-deoxy-L-arabinose transferase-like glycosyltransferase
MTVPRAGMSRRAFAIGLLAILSAAALLRFTFPAVDPPWNPSVGIVWHDEGAWVHNARNKALFGAWSLDAWNPMFIAPVFTGLEYVSFELFGVGVRQARLVPAIGGLVSVWLLALGVAVLAGRRSGLVAGTLLATNYVYVMWNRAALMEGPMVAFIVASWYCYVRAQERAHWGWAAGACALLAFFTKASAVFFVAALTADALATIALARWSRLRRALGVEAPVATTVRGAGATLVGLAMSAAAIVAVFVLPSWTEYQFYNWEMSVTRKPSYSVGALLDRASWLPIVQDFFTRMWLAVVAAALAAGAIVARWRTAPPGERVLVLWILVGLAELIVHDAGNERRYVMFIPPLIGLAALLLGAPAALVSRADAARWERWLALPLAGFAAYLVIGSLVRMAFLPDIRAGDLRLAVRLSAVLGGMTGMLAVWHWRTIARWLSQQVVSARGAAILVGVVVAGDLAQYAQWAAGRSYKNYRASVEIGRVLPPDTPVHGKLANGLSLENRIRPIFVGRGFGNYEDRKTRDDVRYILTYTAPYVGYEGRVIQDVLGAYPDHRIIMTFDVAETVTGHDRAALIDKFGGRLPPGSPQTSGRAQD